MLLTNLTFAMLAATTCTGVAPSDKEQFWQPCISGVSRHLWVVTLSEHQDLVSYTDSVSGLGQSKVRTCLCGRPSALKLDARKDGACV